MSEQTWSLTFHNELGKFTFPLECQLDISGGATIVKRSVAKSKARGTVKERWGQKDYTIRITGILESPDSSVFPEDLLNTLLSYCEAPLAIRVYCEPLQMLGIDSIVIEDWNLPHTKGIDVQYFELNCVSDNEIDLLVKKR